MLFARIFFLFLGVYIDSTGEKTWEIERSSLWAVNVCWFCFGRSTFGGIFMTEYYLLENSEIRDVINRLYTTSTDTIL